MMGRLNHDQRQLFYSFCLEDAVPGDHLVRAIAEVLDLSWVHTELAPHYSNVGRPSIDPVLMIRMLVIGYVFAIRSALCREVQVNLAYRWFCGLSIEDKVADHSAFSMYATSGSVTVTSSASHSNVWWKHVLGLAWSAEKVSQLMPV
jgi:transposase